METKTLKVGDKVARIDYGSLQWIRIVKRITETQAIIAQDNHETYLKKDYRNEGNLKEIGSSSGFRSTYYVLVTEATKPRIMELQALKEFHESRYSLEQLAISLRHVNKISTKIVIEIQNIVVQIKNLQEKLI
ncbi:MAG: hypothetical protein AAFO96_03525 [Bacteroidota bacterium]